MSACAPEPQQIPEFETVTVDLTEPSSRLGAKRPGVPLPARKPAQSAAERISAGMAAFVPRMPNLRQISACDGTADAACPAFAP